MSIPALYPPAVKDSPYNKSSGVWNGQGEWKLCLHTTETAGEPGYDENRLAPHLTYNTKTRTWKQHYDLTRPSESLRTYDNYQVFQVEITCYSNKSVADQKSTRLWVGDLSDIHLQDLADFTKWLQGYVPIRSVWPGKQAYSYSQANAPGFRMTADEFKTFNGILAHQHVPGNTHWDTGAFPWDRFMAFIEGDSMPLDQIGKAVVDIAFDLLGAQGDRNYWYNLEPDDPEFEDLRSAIRSGATAVLKRGEGVTIT